MEITASSSVLLETPNSQIESKDVSCLSESEQNIEVSPVDAEHITPVSESQSHDTSKNIKVQTEEDELQNHSNANKVKKAGRLQKKSDIIKIFKNSKKTQSKKISNIVKSGKNKCNGKKSFKVRDPLSAAKNGSEKVIIHKQQKNSKPVPAKKPQSDDDKQKIIPKHSSELLLSNYVTLSRDWTANRKTYTRNTPPVCIQTTANYDCLVHKSNEINFEPFAESDNDSVQIDSNIKGDNNTLPTDQISDKVISNDRTFKESIEINMPPEVGIQQTTCGEKDDNIDMKTENDENETNNSNELPVLQNSMKTTILKQKHMKSKRKFVHFSDKIDLPIDTLNRNEIVLETANNHIAETEKSVGHLSDISANDAENASIEINKIQCPIIEHGKANTYIKAVLKNALVSDEKERQAAIKKNIVKRKRGRPRKIISNECKNSMLKTKSLLNNKLTGLQNRKFKSSIISTDEHLQSEGRKSLLSSRPVRKRGRPRKIIGNKVSVVVKKRSGKTAFRTKNGLKTKRDRKVNIALMSTTDTIPSQQFARRKRGRPRKYPIEDFDCYANISAAKKMKPDDTITKFTFNEKPPSLDQTFISVDIPAEKLSDECGNDSRFDNKHKQVIATDLSDGNTKVSEQQSTITKQVTVIDILDDGTSKPSVSDSCIDIGKLKIVEQPCLNVIRKETKVCHHTHERDNSDVVCSENLSIVKMNKEQNVQSVEKSIMYSPDICEANEIETQQGQEMHSSEKFEVLVCSEINVIEDTTDKKKYRNLELSVQATEGESYLDTNLNKNKTKELDIQSIEMNNLETVKNAVSVNATTAENKTDKYKMCNKQRSRWPTIETLKKPSYNISNSSETKHLEGKPSVETSKFPDATNCEVITIENDTEVHKEFRNQSSSSLKISEKIKNNNNQLANQRERKRKYRKTANVIKQLLKKTDSISRSKNKRKIVIKPGTSKSSIAEDGEKKSFTCGVCKLVFNKFRDINHHIMLHHNGLARINDDTPFSAEEEITAFNKTLKTVRRLQCLQPGCGKNFISVLGYKYHRENCGVEVPKVNCEICGKAVKQISLACHMRFSHPTGQDIVEEPIPGDLPRRGAAVKALKKMENFIKTQKFCLEDDNEVEEIEPFDDTDDSDYQESELSEEDYNEYCEDTVAFSAEMLYPWKKNVKTPADIVEEISQEMSELWEKAITETGILQCSKKNCIKKFTSVPEMKSHLEHCTAKKWICKLCEKEHSQGHILYSHMKRKHCVQETSDELDEASRHSSYSQINCLLNTSSEHAGSSRLLSPYLPVVEWNMNFRKKYYKNELFSQWKPHSTNWIQMTKKSSADYLPPLKESAYIKSLKEENSVWTKLSLFECPHWADKRRQKTFFVGGAVWGSSWCPTGTNSSAIQFLALAANNPAPHPLTSCSNQKGLIQLWNMGILETNKSLHTPNLALAIAHENGSIWDMEWCPSGCWEEALDEHPEKKSEGILPRLGLLAVACSNSSVRIYSIPHPFSVMKTKDNLPIFKCRPAVILICPESGPNISCHRTLCTKVSWQSTNNHSCLAGGYGNGMVCIWNLTSSSPLLVVSQFGGQLTLRPYLSFPAHGACIMGLVWVPVSGGQYLSTAGYDRSVKVWNLQDHNWPLVITKRGLITDIAWLPYWCGAFASLDDCYNLHHTATFYKECGYYHFAPKALSAHFGCTWSLSVSDWLNTEASGDAGGEVIITVLSQLMKLVDSIKLMNQRRVPLFRITMEALDNPQECDKEMSSTGQNEEGSEESMRVTGNIEKDAKATPINQKEHIGTNVNVLAYSVYEEAVKKFGLILQDNDMDDFSSIPEREFRRIRRPETMSSYSPDQYPLNSINKVSWNPNLGSHLWLFSAGQAGIARISCVYGLQSDKLRNVVTKCREKLKAAVDDQL